MGRRPKLFTLWLFREQLAASRPKETLEKPGAQQGLGNNAQNPGGGILALKMRHRAARRIQALGLTADSVKLSGGNGKEKLGFFSLVEQLPPKGAESAGEL